MGASPTNPNQYFTPTFDASIPQPVATHFRQLYLAVNQHDLAIKMIHATAASTSTTVTNIINQNPAGTSPSGGSGSISSSIGAVNNQTGQTAYTLQATDNGAQVRLGDASPIAVVLNSTLIIPYFTTLSNEGPSLVTATPSTGLVNGVASIGIAAGSWVTIYFDGVNWEADSPGTSVGGVNQIIAGTNVTISPVGGTGAVTINATGGGGGGITRGALNTNTHGQWWVWSDGVIEQWGSVNVPATSLNETAAFVTFPTPFVTGLQSLVASVNGLPRSGSNDGATIQFFTPTLIGCSAMLQCNVPTGGGGATFDQAVTFYWRAIGV